MKSKQSARNFHNYKVWQDAVSFATMLYQVTDKLPWFEKKGLCDQMQRAVVSISSNEVETQLIISRDLNYIDSTQFNSLMEKLNEIQKQLTGKVIVDVDVDVEKGFR